MRIRQGAAFGIGIGVLVAGFGSVAAFAATPAIPGSDGFIRICVEAKDVGYYNDLRFLLNNNRSCRAGEKLIYWNQRGRTGATGAKGATGAQGLQGEQGDPGPAGGGQGFFAEDRSGKQLSEDPTVIVSKDLPAGKYMVTGSVEVANTSLSDGRSFAGCWFGDSSAAGVLVRLAGGTAQEVTLVRTFDAGGGGTLSIQCKEEVDPDDPEWFAGNAWISAIKVDSIS